MFKNYLKIALRNVVKHKVYAFINIAGLATSFICAILIFLWTFDEISFDTYHKNVDSIYRLNWDFNWRGNAGVGSGTPPPLAEALHREIPEVAEAMRVYNTARTVVRYEDKNFSEEKIFAVDPNVFHFFTVKMIAGEPESALSRPNSIVLTESVAKKYFGSTNPLGKILNIGETKTEFNQTYSNAFVVTGIVKDAPHNSHFQFDMLTSMASYPTVAFFDWSWIWMQVTTYARLENGVQPETVEAKIPTLVEKYAPDAFKRVGFSYQELLESGGHWRFVLQPMGDIYLGSSQTGNRLGPIGNEHHVYLFSAIAVIILFLACINFMNLATARSNQRAKEIGIRKTLGSARSSLAGQFLVESIVYSLLALPIALLATFAVLSPFNSLAGKELTFHLFSPWWFTPALIGLSILVGFIAGSYPGFYLSSFHPVHILKLKCKSSQNKTWLRNGLVIFQFAITIGLIVCTLLVQKQMHFLLNSDLGFDKDGVVVISNENHILGSQAEVYKEKIKTFSGVRGASVTSGIPPLSQFTDYYKLVGQDDAQFTLTSYLTDADFCKTMGIKISDGRGFSKDFSTEKRHVIINETAAHAMDWDDPIGKQISYPGQGIYTIIGVMEDFNAGALYFPIQPFALFHASSNAYQISDSYIVVRLSKNNIEETLKLLKTVWQEFAPNSLFNYEFIDQRFASEYSAEQRLGQLFVIFSFLTIFIACIGLFGLTAFSVEQRTKEIGIRKVHGARVLQIVKLLSKEFVKLILISNVFAWPIAWYFMDLWLQNFAYHVEMSWWLFALATGIGLFIAQITVSTQAIRAAVANPIDALRYE